MYGCPYAPGPTVKCYEPRCETCNPARRPCQADVRAKGAPAWMGLFRRCKFTAKPGQLRCGRHLRPGEIAPDLSTAAGQHILAEFNAQVAAAAVPYRAIYGRAA